ncbi:DedA family protein [Microbacterium rhizomatis]|uniref:DedA family protein n=1 Tax=Microbacterium rhizomatis TaxID=1631477 RepID=A0A5J5J5B8_9MICO|nr:DedA family protein [Microbacterium rhizomatis]KAA9110304.1 DedA family protein [Microbacterium rhizomatis]
MHHIALIPWLDPTAIIQGAGPWALLVVCFIVFAETGLLIGFLLPGDTLLVISGLLTHTNNIFGVNIWVVSLLIALAAFIGGEVGYWIGHKGGPAIFEKRDSGLFSVKNVERTNAFFLRYGALAVILARFVPIVRTFAPVAAGIGHMNWRKYSLYNAVGAILWGFGLTMLGYAIAFVPWIADLVTKYIDIILLVAVGGTAIVTLIHYLNERRKTKKERATITDAQAEALALDPEVFQRGPEHHDGPAVGGETPRP